MSTELATAPRTYGVRTKNGGLVDVTVRYMVSAPLITVSSPKVKGWRSLHKKIAKRRGYGCTTFEAKQINYMTGEETVITRWRA